MIAIDAAKGTIKSLVKRLGRSLGGSPRFKRVKQKKDPKDQLVRCSSEATVEMGKSLDLSVYQGVSWTDEREPIEPFKLICA